MTSVEASIFDTVRRGLWEDNPGLVQLLGLCPLLAVTTTLANGLGLGMATLFVGIHAEWRLAIVGLLLVATLAAAVAAEQFFWIMLIPVVVAVWLIRRRR